VTNIWFITVQKARSTRHPIVSHSIHYWQWQQVILHSKDDDSSYPFHFKPRCQLKWPCTTLWSL